MAATNRNLRSRRALFCRDYLAPAVVGFSVLFGQQPLAAQDLAGPLDGHPTDLGFFETANQLGARNVRAWVGSQQNDPSSTSGTGNQLYFGGFDWGVTSRLELGFAFQDFEDPVSKPINGSKPDISYADFSVSGKYRLFQTDRLSIAVKGSVESLAYQSVLFTFGGGTDTRFIIGSLSAPITYEFAPEFQLHLTPAVSVFPDTVNGVEFFGTVASIGLGASWKPTMRWTAYGSVTIPVGPGGNTISSTATITNTPIWTVGTRFNATPKVGVDLYATNGFGATPATRILSFPPDGDTPIIGVRLNYTPGYGPGYRSTYRGPMNPLSERAVRLQQDGFTLSSGDTNSPETITERVTYGTNENSSAGVFFSPDQDIEIEAIYEHYANDGSLAPPTIPNTAARYMLGGKLRLLDQNNGDAVSLSLHPLVGRDTTLLGIFYFGVPITYQASPTIAVMVNPKAAAWGNEFKYGIGLGVNIELGNGMQLIGEITPVGGGDPTVWAAGMRYFVPNTGVSLDAHATNAIGSNGLGTLIGQKETKFAIGATWTFGSPVFYR